jgi:tetratricopeptide (TPR) repeat protein
MVQGKIEEAIYEFNKALSIDPEYVEAQDNLNEARRLMSHPKSP